MKYYYSCIEQLDLAVEQLRHGDPQYARFALLLTDNIVELMLHTQCEHEMLLDKNPFRPEEQTYDRKRREEVLKGRFPDKNAFCLQIGKVTQAESDFIRICHGRYRNELYHQGLRYEDILFPLAWHYHQVACDLLRRFRRIGWWEDRTPSEVVRRHVGVSSDVHRWHPDHVANAAANSLSSARPPLSERLPETLAKSAETKIGNVEGNLEYLVSESSQAIGTAETIERIQFHYYTHSERSKDRIDFTQIHSVRDLEAELDRVRKTWSPPHPKNPIPGWRKRALRIRTERCPMAALVKFQCLRDHMEVFEQALEDAAIEQDTFINAEIARMRGN